jgi:hypothetical protein
MFASDFDDNKAKSINHSKHSAISTRKKELLQSLKIQQHLLSGLPVLLLVRINPIHE